MAFAPELDPEQWVPADRLLIGEFLRRYHARLSHEMALHGMLGGGPGAAGLGEELNDAIGVVARSHGESLRQILEYVRYRHPGNLRPAGAALVFHMGLLRVADYLQLDADRAPALLFDLRSPASLLSIREWKNHQAVATISWQATDPQAIAVSIQPPEGVRTFLQMRRLLAGLQHEMDVTSAVLREAYGGGELGAIRLSRTRIASNLDSEALHERLSFVPREAGLRSGDDLFRLVVRHLYGNQPAVAGRELLQNAVDAVRERWRLELVGELSPAATGEPDVTITVEEIGESEYVLRVTDTGIGMSPEIVTDYFLKAGASVRPDTAAGRAPHRR